MSGVDRPCAFPTCLHALPARPLPAYILAGGRSRRFGADKARALFHGEPLICNAARAARRAGFEVTVIADKPAKYADIGLTTIADVLPGFGPLGGLFTLWNHAPQSEWALVIACDLAPIEPAWLQMLEQARHDAVDAVMFGCRPRQPLLACYRRTTVATVLALLGSPQASMKALLERCRVETLAAPATLAGLCNINRRCDLAAVTAAAAEEALP